jgi:hypothetical protein
VFISKPNLNNTLTFSKRPHFPFFLSFGPSSAFPGIIKTRGQQLIMKIVKSAVEIHPFHWILNDMQADVVSHILKTDFYIRATANE